MAGKRGAWLNTVMGSYGNRAPSLWRDVPARRIVRILGARGSIVSTALCKSAAVLPHMCGAIYTRQAELTVGCRSRDGARKKNTTRRNLLTFSVYY